MKQLTGVNVSATEPSITTAFQMPTWVEQKSSPPSPFKRKEHGKGCIDHIRWSLTLSTPVMALTDEECAAMWKSADANADGMISGAEADRYAAAMRVANKTVPDSLDQAAFIDNCKADVFTTASTEEGAPLAGANSFTENQAKERVMAAGFGERLGADQRRKRNLARHCLQGRHECQGRVDYKGRGRQLTTITDIPERTYNANHYKGL